MLWNADPESDFSLGIWTTFTSRQNFLVVIRLRSLSAVVPEATRHLGNTCKSITAVTETGNYYARLLELGTQVLGTSLCLATC
jgi:hypothetical protein